MLQPIHLVATLINPSHQGASLSTEEYIDATKFIYIVSLSRDIDTKVVLSDITNYKTKSFGFCEKNVFENQLILWNLSCVRVVYSCSSLSNVATTILSAPTTSAAKNAHLVLMKIYIPK